jgi:Sigma-70 region 2
MAFPARPHHLPEFALKLVRARARELSRRGIIPAYERRDIEQHFLLELLRRWQRFDGNRGGLPGFVVRVIDNSAADLIGRHARLGRVWPLEFVSLDEVVRGDDGDIATIGDGLSEDQALWQVPTNEFDATDLRVDLSRAVRCLPFAPAGSLPAPAQSVHCRDCA